MNYFFSLIFLFFSISLQSQVLTRSSNDLYVKLPNVSEDLTSCKVANKVDLKLLEKVEKEDELTCSDQRSWELVSSIETEVKHTYVFDDQPFGIYKVEMRIPLTCSESKIASKYKIAKIYNSNILNDRKDTELKAVVQKTEEMISVYPNPSADKIWVNLKIAPEDLKENFMIQLVDGTGQLIRESFKADKNLNAIELDLSGYPAGQYTVVVLKNDQIFASQKIAKITK